MWSIGLARTFARDGIAVSHYIGAPHRLGIRGIARRISGRALIFQTHGLILGNPTSTYQGNPADTHIVLLVAYVSLRGSFAKETARCDRPFKLKGGIPCSISTNLLAPLGARKLQSELRRRARLLLWKGRAVYDFANYGANIHNAPPNATACSHGAMSLGAPPSGNPQLRPQYTQLAPDGVRSDAQVLLRVAAAYLDVMSGTVSRRRPTLFRPRADCV